MSALPSSCSAQEDGHIPASLARDELEDKYIKARNRGGGSCKPSTDAAGSHARLRACGPSARIDSLIMSCTHPGMQAITDGVLKVMSKMGISTIASYKGSQVSTVCTPACHG